MVSDGPEVLLAIYDTLCSGYGAGVLVSFARSEGVTFKENDVFDLSCIILDFIVAVPIVLAWNPPHAGAPGVRIRDVRKGWCKSMC